MLTDPDSGATVVVIVIAAIDPETGEPIAGSPGPDPLAAPPGGISQAVWDKLRELYGVAELAKAKQILGEWDVTVYNGKQRYKLDHGAEHITVVGKNAEERARALHSALSNLSSIEKFGIVDPSHITKEQAIELIHAGGYHDGENIVVTLDDGTRVVLKPAYTQKHSRAPKVLSHYTIAGYAPSSYGRGMAIETFVTDKNDLRHRQQHARDMAIIGVAVEFIASLAPGVGQGDCTLSHVPSRTLVR